MTKLYYITTKAKIDELQHRGCHWLALGEDLYFVGVEWRDNQDELAWATHADVMVLPHPVFEQTNKLRAPHVNVLQRRWQDVDVTHTIHDLLVHVAAEDIWMSPRVL
jgi:hypothetical protein